MGNHDSGRSREKEEKHLDRYREKRSHFTVDQYFDAVALSRSHRQSSSRKHHTAHHHNVQDKSRKSSTKNSNGQDRNMVSSERGSTSINISEKCFRRCIILLLISFLSIASVNIMLSSFISLENTSGKSNPQSAQSRWTHRKILSSDTKVIQTDQHHNMFRMGRLLEGNTNTMRSLNNLGNNDALGHDEQNVMQTISQADDGLKRKRLLYGTKHVPEMANWPPLSALIDPHGGIRDDVDVSGILDFAIVGFSKTGTTTLLKHLSGMTDSLPKEHCDLVVNDGGKLLKGLYEDHGRRVKQAKKRGEELEDRLRGLKCPQDLSSDYSMLNYARHFPSTKLIVGIRHPVLWFESLYNFRVSNVPWKAMLPTSELTKGCISGSQGVCAWRASFHDFLSRMGKTPMTSKSEKDLLQLGLEPVKTKLGPVFLYEISQLSDSGDPGGARSAQFRKDLKRFLGLQQEIPPFPFIDTSGRFDFVAPVKRQVDQNKINICDANHDAIRGVLMEKARLASEWIRDYFLQSEEVFVSSRQHFELIIDSWRFDPCTLKK